jgi:hypothetical protein
MSQKSACRIIFTLLFTLAASISNATDVFQSPSQMSECDWSLVANAINPEGYRLYSLDAIAEFEARGFFSQAFGDDDRPNDTTADRLENKNWGSLQDIDTTLEWPLMSGLITTELFTPTSTSMKKRATSWQVGVGSRSSTLSLRDTVFEAPR